MNATGAGLVSVSYVFVAGPFGDPWSPMSSYGRLSADMMLMIMELGRLGGIGVVLAYKGFERDVRHPGFLSDAF